MNSPERERRDWILLPIIVLLGILFMYLAGQRAIRMAPSWHVVADMASNLDPNAQFQEAGVAGVIEPVRAEILTPPVWAKTYLTPGANNGGSGMVAPAGPASNSPTPVAPSPTPVEPTATPVSASPTPTAVVTQPPAYVPPQPTATKKKKDKPPAPTATPVPTLTTLDPTTYTENVPTPASLNVGPPDGNVTDNDQLPGRLVFRGRRQRQPGACCRHPGRQLRPGLLRSSKPDYGPVTRSRWTRSRSASPTTAPDRPTTRSSTGATGSRTPIPT